VVTVTLLDDVDGVTKAFLALFLVPLLVAAVGYGFYECGATVRAFAPQRPCVCADAGAP
jgi:hypothetical protein